MGFMDWIKGKGGATFQLNNDDIVVFVVGPSGGGKSLFVEEVTKSDLVKVGDNLRPCTANVQAIRCELTEEARVTLRATTQRNIVFVDTPSFHTGENAESDTKADKVMTSWLSKSKCKSTLVGTMYLHRVETDPTLEPIQNHLNTFALTFPDGFVSVPKRLHALLSYEGSMTQARTEQREQSFRAQLAKLAPSRMKTRDRLTWKTSMHPKLFQRGDSEMAWQAVVELFSR